MLLTKLQVMRNKHLWVDFVDGFNKTTNAIHLKITPYITKFPFSYYNSS